MGNSPSRSELHGEHMSNIANSSGQETFQSHSYPAKFSTNPLPGIHRENGINTIKRSSPTTQDISSGRQTGGPNTPDPMYSMDSLNVIGNNSASITSSELPPSSISPENRRDPWVQSSFSDESLHAQCRNMSRLHKSYHNADDEGLSSITYESDSLNPDATLSGMQPKTNTIKRETTPKPEVAEEAKEELPIKPTLIKCVQNASHPLGTAIDHGITINGRKVSSCEETPLPLILGSQKESKIGVTPSEFNPIPISTNGNFGTIKRGRMKSPPPPPPPSKNQGNNNNIRNEGEKRIKTSSSLDSNDKKDFQNSLNALLRRSVFSSNRRSSIEIGDSKTVCGGEVSVIQTPLSQPAETNGDESPSNLCVDQNETKNGVEIDKSEVKPFENIQIDEEPSSTLQVEYTAAELTNRKISATISNANGIGKSTDIPSTPETKKMRIECIDTNSDTVIRPCEQSNKTQNHAVAATQSVISKNEINKKELNVLLSTMDPNADSEISDDSNKNGIGNTTKDGTIGSAANNYEKVFEEDNHTYHHNKTELGCEDVLQDVSGNAITTASAECAETKPVSCAANSENLHNKEQDDESSTVDDDDMKEVKIIDGSQSLVNKKNDNVEEEEKVVAEVDAHVTIKTFVESEVQKYSPPGKDSPHTSPVPSDDASENSSSDKDVTLLTTASSTKAMSPFEQTLFSKFGNDDDKSSSKGDVKNGESDAARANTEGIPSPTLEANVKNKSGDSSKSSSRRGSSASSLELNILQPTSNGLLNCNRLSLCSLPDNNELEFETYETVEEIMEDVTIQDQPLSNNSNNELIGVCSLLEDNVVKVADAQKVMEEPHQKPEHDVEISKDEKPEKEMPNLITQKEAVKESRERRISREESGLVNALKNSLEGLIPMVDPMERNIQIKSGNNGHHRRLSMSKIDFENNKIRGDLLATSAPTNTDVLEKFSATRKGSFPELFINTENMLKPTKLVSMGAERNGTNQQNESSITAKILTTNPCHDQFDSNGPSSGLTSVPFIFNNKFSSMNDCAEICGARTKGKPFANDFLQTLGEIYASKSKLLTHKPVGPCTKSPPRSNAASLPPSPKEKEPPSLIITTKPSCKTGEASSIDTVEGIECQDRSISEYNISPRSARELISESLLNCSSMSSSLSQKSIGTIHEVDEKLIAFSAGVENAPVTDPFEIVADKAHSVSQELPNADNEPIPRYIEPKSLTINNSATFKKKPTFIRGRGPKQNSLPCADFFESQPSANEAEVEDCPVKENVKVKKVEVHENFPPPPPMPPLQYCQTPSDSSASSSIGDASELYERNNKTPFNGRIRKKPNEIQSYDKNLLKSNGFMSSECSLVELTTPNPKSTSDAIIIELKQAQAKKLKAIEQKGPDVLIFDFQSKNKVSEDDTSVAPEREERKRIGSDISIPAVECCSVPANLQSTQATLPPNNDVKQPEFPPVVKTIVNGKHTNSIIVSVNSSNPSASCDNPNPPRLSRLGTAQATKFSPARPRGNIMSPSLSGNYTEMNGIDSETMGASSIHDDELSGQLQQKENHINELHGNVEEIQTSNKLDGASFRRVLNEYEKTLSMFIQQIDQLKQRMEEAETEKQTLIKERDQALEDLRNVESAFSDVHRKYERAKALLENMKANEDSLIRRDQEMMHRIQNRDKKIEMIKEKAQESIEKMHLDYETRIKEMEFENAKLRALNRKNEMKLSTLENDVEQKAKENAQLSALCDELINGQVGQV